MNTTGPSANLPRPRRDWGPPAVAVGVLVAALAIWLIATSRGPSRGQSDRAIVIAAATAPASAGAGAVPNQAAGAPGAGLIAEPPAGQDASAAPSGAPAGTGVVAPGAAAGRPVVQAQRLGLADFRLHDAAHVPASWEAGFYPLYEIASRTFGINWLLLASIHKQETAFSTEADTYTGLNFAHCCGGPMQFNVTDGPITTWALVSDSFRYGTRPRAYPHPTRRHPSIYDDFDAMMAAARLLAADGAAQQLDFGAWSAAYDYYGHDTTGVTYADQVIARAISWSQHGFCINCGLDPSMVAAVHAAYGAPVLATLTAAPPRHGSSTGVVARTARASR